MEFSLEDGRKLKMKEMREQKYKVLVCNGAGQYGRNEYITDHYHKKCLSVIKPKL